MRYLFFLLMLAACTATQWRKEGATVADQDRDYDECRQIAKPDPAVAAAFGAFGAIGVLGGVSFTDSKIRTCMQARGWKKPGEEAQAAQETKAAEGMQPVSATPPAKNP